MSVENPNVEQMAWESDARYGARGTLELLVEATLQLLIARARQTEHQRIAEAGGRPVDPAIQKEDEESVSFTQKYLVKTAAILTDTVAAEGHPEWAAY